MKSYNDIAANTATLMQYLECALSPMAAALCKAALDEPINNLVSHDTPNEAILSAILVRDLAYKTLDAAQYGLRMYGREYAYTAHHHLDFCATATDLIALLLTRQISHTRCATTAQIHQMIDAFNHFDRTSRTTGGTNYH
jgi:hypothetical protein